MLPRRPGGDEGVVDNEAKTFEEGRGGGVLQCGQSDLPGMCTSSDVPERSNLFATRLRVRW